MPMWWNENDGSETGLTLGAPCRPSQIVGGISGQMSTAPVLRLCAITSSFWNRIQVIFLAAGYILYDTSNVILHYPPDMHVAASLELLADVAMLFWYIVQILMSLSHRD